MSFGVFSGTGSGALGRLSLVLEAESAKLEAGINKADTLINRHAENQAKASEKIIGYQKNVTDGLQKSTEEMSQSIAKSAQSFEEQWKRSWGGVLAANKNAVAKTSAEINAAWERDTAAIRANLTEAQKAAVAEANAAAEDVSTAFAKGPLSHSEQFDKAWAKTMRSAAMTGGKAAEEVKSNWVKNIEAIKASMTDLDRANVAAANAHGAKLERIAIQGMRGQISGLSGGGGGGGGNPPRPPGPNGPNGPFVPPTGPILSAWQDMVRRIKIASYPMQADWHEMMENMTRRTRGFGLNATNIMRSLLSGVGMGSAMMIIGNAISYVTDRVMGSSRAAKEATESWKSYDLSLRATQKTLMDMAIAKLGSEGQVQGRSRQLEIAAREKAEAEAKVDRLEKERQNPRQFSLRGGMLETMSREITSLTAIIPGLKNKADELKKASEEADSRMKELGISAWSGIDEVNSRINIALDEQKKILDNTRIAYKQAEEELRQAQNKLDEAQGKVPGRESDAEKEARLARERAEKIQQQEAEFAKDSVDLALAEQYRAAIDPMEEYIAELYRLESLHEKYPSVVDAHVVAVGKLDAAERLRAARAKKIDESADGKIFALDSEKQSDMIRRREEFNRDTKMSDPTLGGQIMQLDERKTQLDRDLEMLEDHFGKSEMLRAQHASKVLEIERQKNDMLLSGASDSAGALADVTARAFGEQSGAYKAMFAVSKAFAIAQGMINMQQAISSAMATQPFFPVGMGMAISAAAQGASIIANMQSVALSFEGGGDTPKGPRRGGLDGKGGFMAMVHPNERILDLDKGQGMAPSGAPTQVITVNQTFTGGVTAADLANRLESHKRETISGVAEAVSRAGPYRRQIQS